MRFNDFKTEFLNVGTYHQLRKVDMDSAHVGEVDIIPVKSVRNSGAWSDENMSMDCNILSQVVIMNFTLSKCTEAYIHSIYIMWRIIMHNITSLFFKKIFLYFLVVS